VFANLTPNGRSRYVLAQGEKNLMNHCGTFMVFTVLLTVSSGIACGQPAQPSPLSKFEVGAQVSVLGIKDANGLSNLFPRTEVGGGGRFTYNLKRYLALEAELNLFPRNFRKFTTNFTGGRMIEGLVGVKAGIRRNKFGVFGKFRPGLESSGGAEVPRFLNGDGPDRQNPFGFERVRATQFALDVGGVFEFYPTRRTIIRFDAGDTIVRYPGVEFTIFPAGSRVLQTVHTHRPQFSLGFGVRF
jgi:hypothetical protein